MNEYSGGLSTSKRKLISELVSKINSNNFSKSDFNNLSVKENIQIKKIKLENINDDQVLKIISSHNHFP